MLLSGFHHPLEQSNSFITPLCQETVHRTTWKLPLGFSLGGYNFYNILFFQHHLPGLHLHLKSRISTQLHTILQKVPSLPWPCWYGGLHLLHGPHAYYHVACFTSIVLILIITPEAGTIIIFLFTLNKAPEAQSVLAADQDPDIFSQHECKHAYKSLLFWKKPWKIVLPHGWVNWQYKNI